MKLMLTSHLVSLAPADLPHMLEHSREMVTEFRLRLALCHFLLDVTHLADGLLNRNTQARAGV